MDGIHEPCFPQMVWREPMENWSDNDVFCAMSKILDESDRHPIEKVAGDISSRLKNLLTDEERSDLFQKYEELFQNHEEIEEKIKVYS